MSKKIVYLATPERIINYFEKKAIEELEENCTEINKISIGRLRNQYIINALEEAVKTYQKIAEEDR